MAPNARLSCWKTSAGPHSGFLPAPWAAQTLFLLVGEGRGRLHLTAQSPTLPLCSSPSRPSLGCRTTRNTSQRRKGPGGPAHQQHNSFRVPPEPGLSFYLAPTPPKHEIFLRL